jgi:hypothetical protein
MFRRSLDANFLPRCVMQPTPCHSVTFWHVIHAVATYYRGDTHVPRCVPPHAQQSKVYRSGSLAKQLCRSDQSRWLSTAWIPGSSAPELLVHSVLMIGLVRYKRSVQVAFFHNLRSLDKRQAVRKLGE